MGRIQNWVGFYSQISVNQFLNNWLVKQATQGVITVVVIRSLSQFCSCHDLNNYHKSIGQCSSCMNPSGKSLFIANIRSQRRRRKELNDLIQ